MRHQVVWAKCSVTNPEDDQEKILVKGDILPDWVSDFTRFVLTNSGAVKVVDGPDPTLVPEEELPPPVRLPEHPPAAAGDPRTVNYRSSKAELVDYGVAKGGNRAELEALNIKELQAKYLKADQQ